MTVTTNKITQFTIYSIQMKYTKYFEETEKNTGANRLMDKLFHVKKLIVLYRDSNL